VPRRGGELFNFFSVFLLLSLLFMCTSFSQHRIFRASAGFVLDHRRTRLTDDHMLQQITIRDAAIAAMKRDNGDAKRFIARVVRDTAEVNFDKEDGG